MIGPNENNVQIRNNLSVHMTQSLIWYNWYQHYGLPTLCQNVWTNVNKKLADYTIWRLSWENRPYSLCRCHTKRRISAYGRAHPSFVWQTLFENVIYDVSRVKSWKVGVIPKELWARPWHAHPSFCMTTTKTLRFVFSWCASYIVVLPISTLCPQSKKFSEFNSGNRTGLRLSNDSQFYRLIVIFVKTLCMCVFSNANYHRKS